ncbi:MAG: hypothetical protein Q9217_002501 [Psora testacea]
MEGRNTFVRANVKHPFIGGSKTRSPKISHQNADQFRNGQWRDPLGGISDPYTPVVSIDQAHNRAHNNTPNRYFPVYSYRSDRYWRNSAGDICEPRACVVSRAAKHHNVVMYQLNSGEHRINNDVKCAVRKPEFLYSKPKEENDGTLMQANRLRDSEIDEYLAEQEGRQISEQYGFPQRYQSRGHRHAEQKWSFVELPTMDSKCAQDSVNDATLDDQQERDLGGYHGNEDRNMVRAHGLGRHRTAAKPQDADHAQATGYFQTGAGSGDGVRSEFDGGKGEPVSQGKSTAYDGPASRASRIYDKHDLIGLEEDADDDYSIIYTPATSEDEADIRGGKACAKWCLQSLFL